MKTIKDNSFSQYGKVLDIDTSSIVEYLINHSNMPESNNLYVAHDEEFYKLPIFKEIENKYFGQLLLESGYCNGYNSKLNCMEYHATIEIDVAGTDAALILGKQADIKEGKVNSKDLEVFTMKKGEAVLLYPGTLHFSPCKLSNSGFKMAIILHRGTNLDLKEKSLDPKLWKVNKWLLAHSESNQASLGAYIGIEGENIEIKY